MARQPSDLQSSRGQSCSPSSTQLMSFKPSSLEEEELLRVIDMDGVVVISLLLESDSEAIVCYSY